jgi:NADH-quinone oxidoreductase subunit I
MLGLGLIQGLFETGRNFVGSFIKPERLTTVEYPDQTLAPVEAARTIPFLVYDGADAAKGLRCTACTICETECPPKCIYIVKDTVKKPDYLGKLQNQPKTFDIDISVCMGCGICAEVCPFESIKMDQVFELSTTDRFGTLLLHKEQLAKTNAYFNKIAPVQAAQIDAARAEDVKKAEAKAKADAEAKAKAAAAAVANATSGVAAAAEKAVSATPKPVVASQPAPAPLPASSSSKPSQPLPPAKP